MSVDKAKTSKLLEDLRKFRFQKKQRSVQELHATNSIKKNGHVEHNLSESDDNSNCSNSGVKINNVHTISDSDDHSSNKTTPKKKSPVKTSKGNVSPPKKYSRIKRQRSGSSSSDDDKKETSPVKKKYKFKGFKGKSQKKLSLLEGGTEWSAKVIQSSDDDSCSDDDSDYELTPSREKVLNFLDLGSKSELLQIPKSSDKKIECIINLRPYTGWRDLVLKFKSTKFLNTGLLNGTLEVLKSREIISSLMKRCLKIAISTEKAIVDGSAMVKEQPSIMNDNFQLKSYQMVGLNWLAVMHNQDLNGILADEMGLGKTIQVIAFFSYLKQNGLSQRPHLLVVPSSTVDNWAIEFTKWSPSLEVVVYHGSIQERRQLRYEWSKSKFQSMDVIITTYNLVGSNTEEKKLFSRVVNIHYVVFDEAHMLKNMNTQRYINLYNINAKRRILLTGTPLQNNLLELMSLLNFVMPHMFSECITHIKLYFGKRTAGDEDLSSFDQEQIELAKKIMKPFVLRRLKDDVLKDLPQKTTEVVFCPMIDDQKQKYNSMMEEIKEWANSKEDYSYMTSFMQLRKLANHPLTCRYNYQEKTLKQIADRLARDETYKETRENLLYDDLCYMSDHEIHQLALKHSSISKFKLKDELFLKSGKFGKLDEILPKLKSEGHRVVIFSQFLFVLDLLEEYMRIRDHTFFRLDGSTNILDRQELIDNFNEDSDIFVFLLTTKAGGVGINLTSADTVIIHDVDFNPYNDKQAEDRCHRLGQTKPVSVLRFVSRGTVEEKIYALAQSKLELEQGLTHQNEDEEELGKNVALLLKELLSSKV